jgi:hypothetical protein
MPRKSAEHLRRRPEFSALGADFTFDSLAEFEKNIADLHDGPDIVSVHFYNESAGNERLGITGHTNADLLDIAKLAADETGKRLFLGEFGDVDPMVCADTNALFSQNILQKVTQLKIPYSAPWAWEFYQTAPYLTYDNRGTAKSLEPGYTDFLLSKITDANAALGNPAPAPESPDLTPPRVVLTWPLDGAAMSDGQLVSAVASDNNRTVSRVTIRVDGLEQAAFTQPPYQLFLNTALLTPGPHQISVEAADPLGNVGQATVTAVKP